MKVRLSSILALLLTAVSGAWADSFSADVYAANATLNGVSVTANQTVTINKDVTVTVNNGLTISTGATLTVTGGGTLVVNGTTGANGEDGRDEGILDGEGYWIGSNFIAATPGSDGGPAITINNGGKLALSNATVIANGGEGGKGGKFYENENYAANGADGNGFSNFPAIEGAVLSYSTNGTDYTEYASGNSTLYRYMKAVAAAPADEITWEGTILSSLQSAKTYTDANGITVSGDGIYGTAYGLTFGQYFGPINFSASKGKFTKIEITCNNLTAGANISGFTHSGNTLTWSGESANVTIPKNNGRNYYTLAGVSSIKFTGVGLVGGPDKSALETAITSAEELYNSIKDNADYTTIASALKTAIDTAKGVAESDEADQDVIDAAATNINVATIIAKIDLLPSASKVTATDKTDIEALRTAYNSLDDTAKGNVTNIAKLETAEVALAIAELPAANTITSENKDAIEAARQKYDALTDAQKEALGTDALGKLNTAEAALAIAELPAGNAVTTADKDAIEAARKAYDELTDAQKEAIGTDALGKLKTAETALAIAQLPAGNAVTTADKDAIETARKAYDELTDAQKEALGTDALGKLNTAEAALAIAELPAGNAVTTADKDAIEAARKAYDELTDAQKEAIGTDALGKLKTAETALAIAQLPAGNAVTTADKDAIEAARKAYDELSDAQKEAIGTDALGKLETAESSLKDVTDTKEELNNAITDAEAYYESIKDKHPEVAATLLEAINKAKELMDNADANKSDVDAAIDALATAKTASEADVLTESKQELTNDIDASENYYATIEKKYPEEASELLEAIITATMVKTNADATQEQVNDAIKALAKVEKKTTLKVNVKEAEEYCESIKEKYPDIVPALTEGINSAKEVAANPDATTQQVEAALEKLATYKTTAENEVLAEAKAQLTADISTADDYAASIEEKYPEIAASFSEAVKGAKDVLDNVDATQQEVEDAIAIVAAAKSTAEGEVLTESKKELSNAITDADDYAASIEEKYPETAASLLEAISGTKDVADKADATQQEIDDAIAIVAAAKATAEQQVLSDTKTELNNDINKAMRYYISIKNSNPNAAATLLDAIVAARAILEDGDATQQDADAALSDIVKALQDAEQATGISLVEAEAYAKKMQNAKVIIGGKLYIFNNGKMYDANGSAVGNE